MNRETRAAAAGLLALCAVWAELFVLVVAVGPSSSGAASACELRAGASDLSLCGFVQRVRRGPLDPAACLALKALPFLIFPALALWELAVRWTGPFAGRRAHLDARIRELEVYRPPARGHP